MKKILVVGSVVVAGAASTFADAPVDMATVSTEIVPYIAGAGAAGLLIYGGIKAIRVVIKAFNAASK